MNQNNQASMGGLAIGEECSLFPPVGQLEEQRKRYITEKRKKWVFSVLWFMGLLLFQFSLGVGLKKSIEVLCTLILALWMGLYFLVALHEVGHTVMGWLAGKKLLIFCLGRWRLEHRLSGWRLRRCRFLQGGIFGFSMMTPSDLNGAISKLGEVGFLLGGCMANFVCAALFWGLYCQKTFSSDFFNTVIFCLAMLALLLGVLNLLPLHLKNGWRTDGRYVCDILFNQQDEDFKRVKNLTELVFKLRPREWSAEQVLMLKQIKLDGKPFIIQCTVNILKFQYACDRKAWAEAQPAACWMAQHFAQIPDGQRQGVATLMAIYALYGKNDEKLFNAWLPLCDDAGLFNLHANCALFNAWLAYFAGEYEQAHQAIQEACLAMSDNYFEATTVALQEYLDELQEKLQKAHSSKPPQ